MACAQEKDKKPNRAEVVNLGRKTEPTERLRNTRPPKNAGCTAKVAWPRVFFCAGKVFNLLRRRNAMPKEEAEGYDSATAGGEAVS